MRLVKIILLTPLALFGLLYVILAIKFALVEQATEDFAGIPSAHKIVAIFGASGTAGDGILKAALADPDIETIHVISRRTTARIDSGVESGKVLLSLHSDYLDYTAIREQIAVAGTVYWAIGISAMGVDEKTYGMIHVDFPLQFVGEWSSATNEPERSFHFISSSDISEDSKAMWVREKIRAEKALFELGEASGIRVIAYRPDYIRATKEEVHIGQKLLYWFFAPVKAAVRATQIGEAMIEVTARGTEFSNGDKIGTRSIIKYSDAYQRRTLLRARN